jgi:hypothetical protein
MLFASTDWVMSLEPRWYSTMFVVIFAADQFLAALAFTVVIVTRRARRREPGSQLTPKQLLDMGNLLLAFVIFWAYVTFSQFLITWSGNLPREISWYLDRSSGGWPQIAMVLVLVQFGVPFVLLLARAAKRHEGVLGIIAAIVFCASVMHTWWLIAPAFQKSGVRLPFLEIAALAGVGGLWGAVFFEFFKERLGVQRDAQQGVEVAHG